ncbi:shikimate dehydrogenase [Robertmurraya andreesenii]|uniref:Shikimate dehydrogenase (NADP(+)) n=1 Tax=Anoxybacillus andreesenii TaxID=1325932 RepID=A0ABT9V8A2_9BACL|nr:shikimate dehydrogenase [Robertmurraya andreesenii]MDQ0157178.1 shikimate dehydrogenase [Robertmurraya andreesenii]
MNSLFERISGKTKLIALLGSPVSHSYSPRMYNLAFENLGLDYAYLAFNVENDQLKDVIRGLRGLGLIGFNVTMPYKTNILTLLDELSTSASLIGSVNTVVNTQGRLIGHNTDGMGFVKSLNEVGIQLKGRTMTLLGAGGAATAIAIQAAMNGLKGISIFNRKDDFWSKAEHTVEVINKMEVDCKCSLYDIQDYDMLRKEIENSDILTNSTKIGMVPHVDECPIPDGTWLRPNLIVTDTVYQPVKTKLLQLAEQNGCKIVNGLGMMLWQGALAFEIWTEKAMPIELIRKDLFEMSLSDNKA